MRDDTEVGGVQWGTPLPVDPGKHRIVATAPGRRDFSDEVVLKESGTATLPVPTLDAAPEQPQAATPAPATAAPAAATGPSIPPDHAAEPQHAASGGGPSPLVIGLGVLGVVGLGTGTVLGFMTKSKFDDSKQHCNPDNENLCTAQGVDLRDNAFTLGYISTASFVIGGVALAGAAVLWIVDSGSSHEKTATVRSFRAGVSPNLGRPTFVMQGSF
jgi:hypothetical protein